MTTRFSDSFSATRFWYSVTTSILLPIFVDAFEGVEIPEGGADPTGVTAPDRSNPSPPLKRGAFADGVEPAAFFADWVFKDDPKFIAAKSNWSCDGGTSSSSKNSTMSSSCVADAGPFGDSLAKYAMNREVTEV